MALTTSSAWDSSVALSNTNIFPLIRIYYGNESSNRYIAVSSSDVTHDSVFYRGLLKSNPTVTESINIIGHKYTIGNITLTFINYEFKPGYRFGDYIEDTSLGSGVDIGFYNRKCDIRLASGGVATWANAFPYYTGIVRAIEHGIDTVKFVIEDRNSLIFDSIIPKERVDATTYPLAPNDSLGKPINIVIGDHDFTNIDDTDPNISLAYDSIMVKGIDTKTNRNEYVFANDTSYAITTDDIWLLDTGTDRFLKVDSTHVTISNPDSDGYTSVVLNFTYDSVVGDMAVYDWWRGSGGSNPSADYDFSNPGYAGDGDLSTQAVLNTTFRSASTSADAKLRVTFDDYDMAGYKYIDGIEIFYKGNYTLNSGNDSAITAYVGGSGIDVSSTLNVKAITSAGVINDIGSSALSKTTHTLEYSNGDGSDTFKLGYNGNYTANIAESASFATLSGAIEALDDFDSIEGSKSSNQFFIRYEGKSMGKSIPIPDVIDQTDDLKISIAETQNGKTATTDNVGSAGSGYLDLTIRQSTSANEPAITLGVFELYKKVKVIFGSANLIDRNRFEVYARISGREYGTWVNGRSTAEGFSVNHPKDDDSGDLIENPSGVIESIYRDDLGFTDADIVRDDFNITADFLSAWKHSFTISEEAEANGLITSICRESRSFSFLRADNTIRHKVIKDTYSSSDITVVFNDILNISFKRTPIGRIITKTRVHYAPDYSGGRRKETSASQSTDAQSKYNITADQSLLEYKSYHISDTTTANSLRDYLLAQWKQPHNIVTVSLPVKYMKTEIGDVVEFTDYPDKVFGEDITANATRIGQTIYKYWFVIGTRKSIDNIEVEAFQLHDLS